MAKTKGEWRKIEDKSTVKWETRKNPVEGKLIDVLTVKSTKGKKGTFKIFKIQTAKEGVLSCAGIQIENKLEGVKRGSEVRIVPLGKVKTANKFQVNTFDIFVR